MTTIRLDPEDVEALSRARASGVSASELVREGLRAVGARYYRPREAEHQSSPYRRAWLREKAAFDRLSGVDLERYSGRWVVVRGGRVTEAGDDLDVLVRRAFRKSRAAFYVGRVGGELPVVDMPGFDLP